MAKKTSSSNKKSSKKNTTTTADTTTTATTTRSLERKNLNIVVYGHPTAVNIMERHVSQQVLKCDNFRWVN